MRDAKESKEIVVPKGIAPYPAKKDASTDKPVADGGGNFGRIARTGIMDSYMTPIKALPLCGIRASYWLDFFKMFGENASEEKIQQAFQRLRRKIEAELPAASSSRRNDLLSLLHSVSQLLESHGS